MARGGESFTIAESDIMEKVREDKVGSTTLFVVDASGSMGARKRMSAAKGAVLSLLIDAYQKRDRVGLISFRGNNATLLVPPTNSIDLAKRNMDVMPTGGKTPLSDALMTAFRTFEREIKQHPKDRMSMILISDGKGNVSMSSMRPLEEAMMIAGEIKGLNVSSLVLDTEVSAVSLGFAKRISDSLGGRYMRLSDIESSSIIDAKKGAGL
ncbi:MAG: VWA domain-containing protein [Candidatus Methanomethylophilaceae archaeon]|nr:VWA domain-containing protein [Candidatus Methanomethylophilaceae archaeon]